MIWGEKKVTEGMIEHYHKYPVKETPLGKALIYLLSEIEYFDVVEIGCGTAQNGELCHNYTGVDYPHVIDGVARKIHPEYEYIKGINSISKEFDLVLTSAYIDVCEHPIDALGKILKYVGKYIIIHRQEVTHVGVSYSVTHSAHGGMTFHSVMSVRELGDLMEENGFTLHTEIDLDIQGWRNAKSYIYEKV